MTRQTTNHTEQRIFEALAERTGTAREIGERIFACEKNVSTLLRRFHLNGWVHIRTWRRNTSGPLAAVFGLGPRYDAAHPGPLTTATICKRYRNRLREKFGPYYDQVREMQRKSIPGSQLVVDGQVVYQQ